MISLTVALPIWNSKKIAWLALESLCNQKEINFQWELLIMEEQIDHFGKDEVSKFADRLKEVGCASLKYFALDYRIPLPQKWKLLAEKMSPTSEVFLLQAADCYSESLRLKRSLEKSREGYDWIQNRTGYYYSLQYKKVVLFDQKTFGPGCRTGLNMAASSKLLKNLPDSFQNSGIDYWLFKSIQPKKIIWLEDEITDGVDTDGLNNISFSRRHNFYNPKPPFIRTNITIEQILPEYIVEKLNTTVPR